MGMWGSALSEWVSPHQEQDLNPQEHWDVYVVFRDVTNLQSQTDQCVDHWLELKPNIKRIWFPIQISNPPLTQTHWDLKMHSLAFFFMLSLCLWMWFRQRHSFVICTEYLFPPSPTGPENPNSAMSSLIEKWSMWRWGDKSIYHIGNS